MSSAGHGVSNFCPLTNPISPALSAAMFFAPDVFVQPDAGWAPFAAKPVLLVKQFQSVSICWLTGGGLSSVMLPSPDSKLLGLPETMQFETTFAPAPQV